MPAFRDSTPKPSVTTSNLIRRAATIAATRAPATLQPSSTTVIPGASGKGTFPGAPSIPGSTQQTSMMRATGLGVSQVKGPALLPQSKPQGLNLGNPHAPPPPGDGVSLGPSGLPTEPAQMDPQPLPSHSPSPVRDGGGDGGRGAPSVQERSEEDQPQEQSEDLSSQYEEAMAQQQAEIERLQAAQEQQQAEIERLQAAQGSSQREMDGVGSEEPNVPVTCYFNCGVLCCVGMGKTPYGMMPLMSCVRMSGHPDGLARPGTDPNVDRAMKVAMTKLQNASIEQAQKIAAEALVLRARCGDQHAMAILSLIRQNASKNPRASSAFKAVREYIDTHPVNDTVTGEGVSASASSIRLLDNSATRFANGPPLTRQIVGHLVRTYGGRRANRRRLITYGIAKFGAEDELSNLAAKLNELGKSLLRLGASIGRARAIQAVRQPGTPLSVFSPKAAWELGQQ